MFIVAAFKPSIIFKFWLSQSWCLFSDFPFAISWVSPCFLCWLILALFSQFYHVLPVTESVSPAKWKEDGGKKTTVMGFSLHPFNHSPSSQREGFLSFRDWGAFLSLWDCSFRTGACLRAGSREKKTQQIRLLCLFYRCSPSYSSDKRKSASLEVVLCPCWCAVLRFGLPLSSGQEVKKKTRNLLPSCSYSK